jgi:hypothetical protein
MSNRCKSCEGVIQDTADSECPGCVVLASALAPYKTTSFLHDAQDSNAVSISIAQTPGNVRYAIRVRGRFRRLRLDGENVYVTLTAIPGQWTAPEVVMGPREKEKGAKLTAAQNRTPKSLES